METVPNIPGPKKIPQFADVPSETPEQKRARLYAKFGMEKIKLESKQAPSTETVTQEIERLDKLEKKMLYQEGDKALINAWHVIDNARSQDSSLWSKIKKLF